MQTPAYRTDRKYRAMHLNKRVPHSFPSHRVLANDGRAASWAKFPLGDVNITCRSMQGSLL